MYLLSNPRHDITVSRASSWSCVHFNALCFNNHLSCSHFEFCSFTRYWYTCCVACSDLHLSRGNPLTAAGMWSAGPFCYSLNMLLPSAMCTDAAEKWQPHKGCNISWYHAMFMHVHAQHDTGIVSASLKGRSGLWCMAIRLAVPTRTADKGCIQEHVDLWRCLQRLCRGMACVY